MLCWKPDDGFRAERLREDPHYGIGTRDDVPVTAFPLAAAITEIEKNGQGIERKDRLQILDLLHQVHTPAATSRLKANP